MISEYMNYSKYKDIINKMFHDEESSMKTSTSPAKFTKNIFTELEYEDNEGYIKTLPICMDANFKDPCIVNDNEGNSYIVVPNVEEKILTNFYGIMAHELGHYLSGHLGSKRFSYITENKDKQEFYLNRYKETNLETDYNNYHRAVYFGILKNGMLDIELEADLVAMKYCGIPCLVRTHMATTDTSNITTYMEKINRIKYLSSLSDPKKYRHISIKHF